MRSRGAHPPLCPTCGEPMLLRHVIRRSVAERVDVWHCGPCGGKALWIAKRHAARGKRKRLPASEPTTRHLRSEIMRRSAEQRLLDEAEQAIRHCCRHQERQRVIIEKRERIGHDASQARQLLRTLQQLQAEHEAYRDNLRAELAGAEPASRADKSG